VASNNKLNADFICLEDEAFHVLIDKVVLYIKQTHFVKEDKWITGEEAMKKLRITSKTTLQKYRDEGRIRFSQADRAILHDNNSINEYLEKHSKDMF
jgi:hypothetical protein